MSTHTELLHSLSQQVHQIYEGRPPAHDALHVLRVMHLSSQIATNEPTLQLDVVHAAALLHELVALPKNHPDSSRAGDLCADAALDFLRVRGTSEAFSLAVATCIRDHAFSKGASPSTLEAAVLQDADRLDALGAIGIARCFATAGELKSLLHHPQEPFASTRELDDKRFALDHFARKLLKLEHGMHTQAARAMARDRTRTIEQFLDAMKVELSGFSG